MDMERIKELAKLVGVKDLDDNKLKEIVEMFASTVQANAVAQGSVVSRETVETKARYGKSPCQGSAVDIHKARLDALDSMIKPQNINGRLTRFTEFANVYSVGKSGKGNTKTRNPRAMTNDPWTWIELSKDGKFGNYDADQLRSLVKLSGYGFSRGNALWVTRGNGTPGGGRGGRCLKVGRQFKYDNNDE